MSRFAMISRVAFTIVVLAALACDPSHATPPRPTKKDSWVTSTGIKIDPLTDARKQTTVLIFLMSDCPIANAYAPEIGRIVAHYSKRGVAFRLVYVDSGVSTDAVQKHIKLCDYRCPAILDPTHTLAQRVGAKVSPEAVVLGKKGTVLYRGRIDNRAADYGKMRPSPSRADLRLALDAILQGKRVAVPRTRAVGCVL